MVKNLKPALLVTALLLNIASFGPAHAKCAPEGHIIPLIVAPGSSTMAAGADVTVTVTFDHSISTSDTVALSTDWVCVTVPSTVTVSGGNTTVSFTAHRASTDDPQHPMPLTTHIRAETPDGYAIGEITMTPID